MEDQLIQQELDEAYNEGYRAYHPADLEGNCPYIDGLIAEYWHDGWADAQDDVMGDVYFE